METSPLVYVADPTVLDEDGDPTILYLADATQAGIAGARAIASRRNLLVQYT